MRRSGQTTEVRRVLALARATGWPLRRKRRSGWVLTPPGGAPIAIHATPSDWRAERNTAAAIRRAARAAERT